jgi:hypothetical protein
MGSNLLQKANQWGMGNGEWILPNAQCPIPNDLVPGFSNRFFRLPT